MDNYRKAALDARALFLDRDQAQMIRLRHPEQVGNAFRLRLIDRFWLIDRSTGAVTEEQSGEEADFSTVMVLYDSLCHAETPPIPAGEYRTVNQMKGIVQGSTVGDDMHKRDAQAFDGREEALKRACERLGGLPAGHADVSYQLPLLDDLSMRFEFWSSDEDFPASLVFKWDENTLSYMHYETVWYAMGAILDRLRAKMEEFE